MEHNHAAGDNKAIPQLDPDDPAFDPGLVHNPGVLREFLACWHASGIPRVLLTAVDPMRAEPPIGPSFAWPSEFQSLLAWVDPLNVQGRRNIHFSVNYGAASGAKLRKAALTHLTAAHADLDPRAVLPLPEERRRLRGLGNALKAHLMPPTVMIDSGGGTQVFWILQEPLPATAENIALLEAINAELGAALGGDRGTHNADRIMRLPETLNWPTASKIAAGRILSRSTAFGFSDRRYTLEELQEIAACLRERPPADAVPWPIEAPREHSDGISDHWFDRLSFDDQLREVEHMLSFLTHPKYGEYDLWLGISFAVYRATDSRGFEIWDAWCQPLPGYGYEENLYKWGTFGSGTYYHGTLVSVGTLLYYAKQKGYKSLVHGGADLEDLAYGLADVVDLDDATAFDEAFAAFMRRRRGDLK